MHALKTLAAAAAASLALAACASGGAVPGASQFAEGPAMRAESHAATVKVANYNWLDVVVYAVQGNSRFRLGQVTSMSTQVFRLPSRFLGGTDDIRLMVDPIGSTEGYMTDPILVHDGQQVNFNVQNALQFSSLAVASR